MSGHSHQPDHDVIHGCRDCCDARGRWIGPAPAHPLRHRLRVWLRSPEFFMHRFLASVALIEVTLLTLCLAGAL